MLLAIAGYLVIGNVQRNPTPTVTEPALPLPTAAAPESARVKQLPVATASESDAAEVAVRAVLSAQSSGSEEDLAAAMNRLRELPIPEHANRAAARQFNEEGLKALRQDRVADAVKEFDLGSQADPADIELIANLGFAEWKAGNTTRAKRALFSALALAPERVASWTALAAALASGLENEAASASYELAYRFATDKEKVLSQLRDLRDKQTDARVVDAMDRFFRKHSEAPVQLNAPPAMPAGVANAPSAPTEFPSLGRLIADMLAEGEACLQNRQFSCALETADDILRKDPRNMRAHDLKRRAQDGLARQ